MGKIIKLTEEELHKIIKRKIQEAFEHRVNLDYSPAIGNKKRGPGKETMDQMKKRRNTKLDEDVDERDIIRRFPGGYSDYDGDDGIGKTSGKYYLELDADAYSYAIKEIYGKVPGNLSGFLEKYELPDEVEISFSLDFDEDPGDYWTPPYSKATVSEWEINYRYVDNLGKERYKIVYKAAEYAMEGVDGNDLTSYLNETNTVRLSMDRLQKLISESVKNIVKEYFCRPGERKAMMEEVDRYKPKMLWVDSRVPGVGSSWYYGGKDQMTMDELEEFVKNHDVAIQYGGVFYDSVYDIPLKPQMNSIDTYGMPTGQYTTMDPTVTIVPKGTSWDDSVYSKKYKWPEGYERPELPKPERDWRKNK